MNRETAQQLANDWYELAERLDVPPEGYGAVRSVLVSLLPEQVDAAVAPVGGEPTVLAVQGEQLFIVSSSPGKQPRPEVRVARLPLTPRDVAVTVIDNPHDMADAQPPGHFRRWQFTWGSGQRVELLGGVRRASEWGHDGPDRAELLARAIVEPLGWSVP